MNWSHLVVSLITSVWYAGFVTRSLQSPLRPIDANSWLTSWWAGYSLDDVRWSVVVGGLLALVAALAVVPVAFEVIERWEMDGQSDVPQNLRRPRLVVALILLTLAAVMFVVTPLVTTALGNVVPQDRAMTIITVYLLLVLRCVRALKLRLARPQQPTSPVLPIVLPQAEQRVGLAPSFLHDLPKTRQPRQAPPPTAEPSRPTSPLEPPEE